MVKAKARKTGKARAAAKPAKPVRAPAPRVKTTAFVRLWGDQVARAKRIALDRQEVVGEGKADYSAVLRDVIDLGFAAMLKRGARREAGR